MGIVGFVRSLDKGMGEAVARRTVFRKEDEGSWLKVADRTAKGNGSLHITGARDIDAMRNAIASGALLMSGRHLQHGDENQSKRSIEVFTNCSTAATSFAKFYLLLNGSGVGRSYDDQMMVVDWDNAPRLLQALDPAHADFPKSEADRSLFKREWRTGSVAIDDVLADEILGDLSWNFDQLDYFRSDEANYVVYDVEDSREGWAWALERYEAMAFTKDKRFLVLNWTPVRKRGASIGGMQDRPASGPMSPMRAFWRISTQVVGKGLPKWRQAMTVDHYTSEEVQVGGARRAARMSTKDWKDPGIFEFVTIKSQGGLWTSNNSVMVDKEFWALLDAGDAYVTKLFDAIMVSSWINGEPGLINGDLLEGYGEREIFDDGSDFRSDRFSASFGAALLRGVALAARDCRFKYITNPCGEIVLHILGAYCVIADIAPVLAFPGEIAEAVELNRLFMSGEVNRLEGEGARSVAKTLQKWDDAFLQAALLATRALIRVNLMSALYQKEVQRTNRIGVGLTGIHEYAWLRFGLTFEDMLTDSPASQAFWAMLKKVSDAVKAEAKRYSDEIGVVCPHTSLTIKPAGTTSKLFALTEGAHLAAMIAYLRWVQFKGIKIDGAWASDADPLLADYEAKGYPMKELKSYPGMTAVGYPTAPLVSRIGMPWVTTASDATPTQQYEYIRRLEANWIGKTQGNQVSYTMKFMTNKMTMEEFKEVVRLNQRTVRCCSIMPSKPASELTYEYLPEEEIALTDFITLAESIKDPEMIQGLDFDQLRCASGACPI